MTRAEIRIAAAMKRLHAAEDAFRRAAEAKRKAEAALASRTQPKIWAARRAVREARAAVTIAQLAARGITPMQTIVEWKGKRYAVRVNLEGWHRLVPVTKRGWVRDDMHEISAPYEWRGVTITKDTVQERPK
jgi:hypothetical protein